MCAPVLPCHAAMATNKADCHTGSAKLGFKRPGFCMHGLAKGCTDLKGKPCKAALLVCRVRDACACSTYAEAKLASGFWQLVGIRPGPPRARLRQHGSLGTAAHATCSAVLAASKACLEMNCHLSIRSYEAEKET